MKLTWITDVHLNFLEKDERVDFYHTLIATDSDGIVVSGDIAEAISIESILTEMASTIQKPIYFVLGNHDYYRGTDIIALRVHAPILRRTFADNLDVDSNQHFY